MVHLYKCLIVLSCLCLPISAQIFNPGSGGGGSGTVSSGTTNTVAKYTASTTVGNSSITDDGTNTGFSEPLKLTEIAAPTGSASFDFLYGDSTAHRLKMINNNGTAVQVVASGVDINTSDQVTATHLASALPVAQGGTGAVTLGANGVVLGQGTSAVHVTSAGTAGQVLTSNGAGVDPTFQAATGGSSIYAPFTQPDATQFSAHTVFGSSTFENATSPNRSVYTGPDVSANEVGAFKAVPGATPYTLTSFMQCTGATGAAGEYDYGISIRNAASGAWRQLTVTCTPTACKIRKNNVAKVVNEGDNTTVIISTTFSGGVDRIWLSINNDGTNYNYSYSLNGLDFTQISTETIASAITADTWGYTFYNNNGLSVNQSCTIWSSAP